MRFVFCGTKICFQNFPPFFDSLTNRSIALVSSISISRVCNDRTDETVHLEWPAGIKKLTRCVVVAVVAVVAVDVAVGVVPVAL